MTDAILSIAALGWKQTVTFEQGLDLTVDWYLGHRAWIDSIRSNEHLKWTKANYGAR